MLRRSKARAIATRFSEAKTDADRIAILEEFVRELKQQRDHPDAAEWLRIIATAIHEHIQKT